MKVLKESKEELPISFITTRLSDSWERIGNLKSEIEAIHKEFKSTGKIEEILQDLMDAEIVCAGRLQAMLDSGKYLDFPEESVKESLTEDTIINIEKVIVTKPEVEVADHPAIKAEEPKAEPVEDTSADEINQEADDDFVVNESADEDDVFNMDFYEPYGPKVTDKELYGGK